MSEKTQNELVLHRLRIGPLTPLEALREFSIMRLGARIWELKGAGHKIESKMIDAFNRRGGPCRVAQYTLIEEAPSGEAQQQDQAA